MLTSDYSSDLTSFKWLKDGSWKYLITTVITKTESAVHRFPYVLCGFNYESEEHISVGTFFL